MKTEPALSPKAKQYSREDVFKWLRAQATKRKMKAIFHESVAKEDGNFLHLSVYLDSKSAFENADALQTLEDSWNNRKPMPYPRLFILPTGVTNIPAK